MDIPEKVKTALSYKDPTKVNDELEKIPDGIVYGRKIRKDGMTITYKYSEKQKAILKLTKGLDIEENTEKFLLDSFDEDDYWYDDEEEDDS